MKISRLIFVTVCCSFCISCARTNVLSEYRDKHFDAMLMLLQDSTFIYKGAEPWIAESSGVWNRYHNNIYLNSYIQEESIPIDYVKGKNEQNGNIVINVDISGGLKMDYICFPYINGKVALHRPDKGPYSFESTVPVDSIYFVIAKSPYHLRGTGSLMSYNNINTNLIMPQLVMGDKIDIRINIIDTLFTYHVFKNETLTIKKRKLIMKRKERTYNLLPYINNKKVGSVNNTN